MRKLFVSVILVFFAINAMAIDLPKQGFGMQIGFAAPTLRLNDKSLNPKDSLINVTKLNGLKLGIVYDASYIAGFGSTLGINYTFAANTTPWVQKYQMKTQPETHTRTFYHEVEVFVDWQYKFELAKETYLMLYTGPSIQYGIAFNVYKDERAWGTIAPLPEETKLRYHAEGDEQLKNLNVTWGVGAGFQYQRFFLRGGYDFGILNPYKNTKFEGSDRYTRGRLDQWSIKVGMYFLYK